MQKSVYEYISKQTNLPTGQAGDPIVEWKTCSVSGVEFPIYKSDMEFYDKISPVINGVKYSIPTPTLCPEERQRRRSIFRNERKLYRRKCDFSAKDIISIYAPNFPYKVYDQKIWRSDKRDPIQYGKDIDVNKSFMNQINELNFKVPKINTHQEKCENSDFSNRITTSKNCYLSTDLWDCENVHYSTTLGNSKDSMDILGIEKNENCYQCINSKNLYQCYYVINSNDCSSCILCNDCQNCENCLLCSNLINQEYCYQNKKVSKEEYAIIKEDIEKNINTYLTKQIETIRDSIKKSLILNGCEGCIGNDLWQCKDNIFSFRSFESNTIKYSYTTGWLQDSYDCYETGVESHLLYEVHGSMYSTKNCFINNAQRVHNSFYLIDCFDCTDCFGCIGLRNKSYCILNKQYTKEEYEELVPKIIEKMKSDGERGEFFNPSLSPFGYNETVANEYFQMTREEALSRGYKWQDNNYDPVIPEGADTIKGDQIPTDISTVTDDILKKIFICEISGRPFRIIKQELDFYHKHNLPLPRKHPDIRHEERMKLRPGRELFLMECDKCWVEMISVYPENYEGKVYCEACYNKEIYG